MSDLGVTITSISICTDDGDDDYDDDDIFTSHMCKLLPDSN